MRIGGFQPALLGSVQGMSAERLTVSNVAEWSHVLRIVVYALATRGEFSGRTIGRMGRFSRDAIDAFTRENLAAPETNRPGAEGGGIPVSG